MDYKVIDADQHVNPPYDFWQEYLPKELRDGAPKLESTKEGDFILFEGGRKPQNAISIANLAVDKARREVRIGPDELPLRTKEFDLLIAFVDDPVVNAHNQKIINTLVAGALGKELPP